MATIIIVGDGPGGLSAALFLARAGQTVTVFGTDQTALHSAYLNNYLGIPAISGSDFHHVAREQAAAAGAELRSQRVISISVEDGFTVEIDTGEHLRADYLILTEGKKAELATALGLERAETGIAVDAEYRSSMDRVYVVGRSARPKRSQVIISAGAGATAALDILSREAGKDVQDWDRPSGS
jgi:thioredoxin reductase (NADPH)